VRADTDACLSRMENGITEIKATLGLLVLLLNGLDARLRDVEAGVAEMPGEMRGQFTQMGQRISDINARLPVPIAYAPPKTAAE